MTGELTTYLLSYPRLNRKKRKLWMNKIELRQLHHCGATRHRVAMALPRGQRKPDETGNEGCVDISYCMDLPGGRSGIRLSIDFPYHGKCTTRRADAIYRCSEWNHEQRSYLEPGRNKLQWHRLRSDHQHRPLSGAHSGSKSERRYCHCDCSCRSLCLGQCGRYRWIVFRHQSNGVPGHCHRAGRTAAAVCSLCRRHNDHRRHLASGWPRLR